MIGGRYQCGPVIGRGGMAEVRAGRDTRLDRPVAIKLLRADLDHQPAVLRRFEAEARLAARLIHPNVVTVFDSGEEGSRPFIVMERLPGWTLQDQLSRGPMPVPAVRTLARQVLAALTAAHTAGIVHRDVKPGNILLGSDSQWKVADFGIAKVAEVAEVAELPSADETATGLVIGTPAYLAPERFFGADATVETDLYALGAVLYESLTGRKPLKAPSTGAWASIAAGTAPAPVTTMCPDVDADLAGAVERCLSKDPEARFPSAAAMTAALSGTAAEATRALRLPATVDPAATQALPVRRPQAQSLYRRRLRTAIGAFAALAILGILAAVIGLNAGGHSTRAAHHRPLPSTPTTTVVPTTRAPTPPSSPAPPPTSASPATSITPSSSPPSPPSVVGAHHPRHGQHGNSGNGHGDGNSNN